MAYSNLTPLEAVGERQAPEREIRVLAAAAHGHQEVFQVPAARSVAAAFRVWDNLEEAEQVRMQER